MSLDIDTQTIRRLRDALIEGGRLQQSPGVGEQHVSERLQASIDRVSPFAETMCLTMLADGSSMESEREAIIGALLLLTDGILEAGILDSMLAGYEISAAEQGVEFRLQTIGAKLCANRQDREIAFTLAAAVAVADNHVAEQELSLIESIAEWYGVSLKRCRNILQRIE
ncbi:MAG: hypothetical protein KUG75_10095 [Pseudomonadales bacterium]|nr:hypothetical protein [Pseudomonadales bacterium]